MLSQHSSTTNAPVVVRTPSLHAASQVSGSPPGATAFQPSTTEARGRRVVNLIMDHSGSMAFMHGEQQKMEMAIESGVRTVASLYRRDPCIEVVVIQFDGSADIVVPVTPLDQDYDGIVRAIQGINIGGDTDQGAAMSLSEQVLMPLVTQGQAAGNIVFMTDGNGGDPLPAANRLKAAGVVIGVTGFGMNENEVNERLLRQVASEFNGAPMYEFARSKSQLTTSMISQANARR